LQLIPPFLANAFERMGASDKSIEQVAVNTGQTAASVSVGGDLYKKMDELVKALKGGTGKGGGKVSIKEALVLRITAGALEPIGLGLGVIIDALERAPEGKELKLKMEALTNGLLALSDIGWSILKFAGLMILALPLLIVAGVAMLLIVPLLKLMVDGLMWATKKLDKKGLERILGLGEVGKALLILSVSLVLMALLAPLILKGLLIAGAVLLGFGLIQMLLDKMKLDTKGMADFGKSLKSLALGLLSVGVVLVLMSLLAQPILVGLATAGLVILTIAGIFWLLDKMQVDKKMRKTSIALMFAAGAILSLSIALVLSNLILSGIGWEEVAKVMLVVVGVAVVFGIVGLAGKQIQKGGKALIYAAIAILGLAIAIFVMKLVLGDFDGDDVLTSFKVLAVIAGIGIVMAVAGLAAKFIKKGSIAMMFAAGAMFLIALGTAAMLSAVKGSSWEEIGMAGAVIVGLALAFGIAGAGPIPVAIALGSLAMAVAGLALLPIALGVKIMLMALKGATWETVGMMGAIIVGLGVSMGVAGLAAPFIVLGAGAMIIAGAATIVIAKGVAELNKLPIAEMFSGKGLFGDSGAKTKGFLGIGGGRAMTNMEVMFEAIANSFSLGPLQIAALYVTSPALILAGLALISIGKGLQEFQKIAAETDLALLGTNVEVVTTTLANAFGAIGKEFPGGAAGLFTNGSLVSQGITSVMGMGDALTSIAIGMQNMANLRFPVKYDKNGKPIEFESMNSDAPAKVAANTATIVNALGMAFGAIGKEYPRAKKGFIDALITGKGESAVEVGIASVSGMGSALTGIALGFQAMANLRFPIAWDADGKPTAYAEVGDLEEAAQRVADNTKLIVTSLSGTFAEIGAGKTSSWWQGATDFEKGVDVVTGLGTPLKNLAEGVINMADMKFPTAYDKDGKATAWINLSAMNPEDLKDKISTNTQTLIEALTDTFTAIGGGEKKTSSWWQGATSFEKGIKVVNMIADPYKKLTTTINDVLGFIDKKIDVTKLGTIVQGLFSTITDVGDLDNKKFWWGTGRMSAITDPYKKLTKTINDVLSFIDKKIDVTKLGTIVQGLFKPIIGVGALDNTLYWYGTGRMKTTGESYERFAGNIQNSAPRILEVDAVKFKENILQLFSAFTTIGGSADPALLNAAKLLAHAVGNTFVKMASSLPAIVGAASKFDPAKGGMIAKLLFGKVDTGNAMNGYNAQTKMQLALATTYGKAGENFPKISSAINALDITKLTESRKMFEALAVLSKGGEPGDILAQMGQSLEEAMQKLADILQEFRTVVENQNENENPGPGGGPLGFAKNLLNGPDPKTPAIKFPDKMLVTLDQASIQAIKKGSSNNTLFS
jgi:hypothetical protein